ncbi:MAG: PHP domain-containing protein [Proteobacteria bacterium]|nr:PHP domain-containing protein [Pseudomonadota bacterium]MCP4917008.1 PHP domain-containing protein [Pseudomonadota bacterium]
MPIIYTTGLLALISCDNHTPEYATAYEMEDLSDGIGGPKALARTGDFILENETIRVAITQPGASMGPSLYGGSLIDADLNRLGSMGGGFGNDRLAETFPTVNMNVMYAVNEGDVEILADGSDGGAAVIRVKAAQEPFLRLLKGLWAIIGAPDFSISTDYIVEPGTSWVTMRTTAYDWRPANTIPSDPSALPDDSTLLSSAGELDLLGWAVETGASFGDFYLQGGNVDVFAPGIGFDEDGAVQEATAAGLNTFQAPFELDFVAGTADGISYGLAALDGTVQVPLFTSSQTAAFGAGMEGTLGEDDGRFPNEMALTYERVFVVGKGDVGSVLDGILAARGADTGRIDGVVVEEGTLEPVSGVSVFVYVAGEEAPYSQWETDVGWDDDSPDGSFGGTLPPGDYELVVHESQNGTGPRVPITVGNKTEKSVSLVAPRAGLAGFTVVDETGLLVPAKLTIARNDGDSSRDPVLGDGYIAGMPEAVVFSPYGQTEIMLPPGSYTAYATRGPEYELAWVDFEVSASSPIELELQVIRSVDTTGWVSADLHVHSDPSHDSGVSAHERIYTMVSEGVEFVVPTDHDFVSDFRPVVEETGLGYWISTVPGVEVTTVEVGHYLGFPVQHDYLLNAGGAFDWTDSNPNQMLDDLVALGDPMVETPVTFVAHPRDGILGYFDQFGFSPYGGEVGEPRIDTPILAITNPLLAASNFQTEFDALELFNGKRMDFLRTPTEPELTGYNDGEDVQGWDIVERTLEEQADLDAGTYTLGYGVHGQIDDWFTLINLGYRYTAIGNSDTHGKTSVESGCPRNYVVSSTDQPGFIDPVELAENVRDGHVVASYGPFVDFTADGIAIVGDDHIPDGPVTFNIEVQSPTWFDVERVELYRNGVLIEVWTDLDPSEITNLVATYEDEPAIDSWYAVIASGSGSLEPMYTPVEYAPVELQDVVTEALSEVDAVGALLSESPEYPRTYPVHPFALTNPIYIDLDGDGFDAPGVPEFMLNEPLDPAEAVEE